MEKELAEGNIVWVKLPYGDFIIDEKKDIVLIAGGTGITAFTAFIDSLKPDFSKSIYLFYGVRKREFLLYQDMIMEKLLSVPKMSAAYFIEDVGSDMADSGEGKPGAYKGMIELERIWQCLENAGNAVFYLSGPPVMLFALSKELSLKGIDKNSIRIDAWE
jgi:ferredoxin-NADP reductase